MVQILANAMATANKFQKFFTLLDRSLIALASGECACPAVENKYEGKKGSAFITHTKVWGFLAY
jgi:hypothetical protein